MEGMGNFHSCILNQSHDETGKREGAFGTGLSLECHNFQFIGNCTSYVNSLAFDNVVDKWCHIQGSVRKVVVGTDIVEVEFKGHLGRECHISVFGAVGSSDGTNVIGFALLEYGLLDFIMVKVPFPQVIMKLI